MRLQFFFLSLIAIVIGTACTGINTGVSAVVPLPENAEIPPTQVAQAKNPANSSNNAVLVTATPSENLLGPGEARAIAMATDTLTTYTVNESVSFSEEPIPLTFDEFYSGFSIQTGLLYSDKLKALDGKKVVMEGYVAPPLKPRLDFIVLTRVQLAFCPFCSTSTDWPDDIALVYLKIPHVISSAYPVRIVGQLEVGSSVDAETGMVSLVRIYAETLEIL